MIERILALMAIKGLNASQLTTELELSNSTISDWKKGKAKPSLDAICKMSKYFNVSLDYLIYGNEAAETVTPQYKRTSSNTSADEKELLSLYRLLPDREQGEILGMLKERTKKRAERLDFEQEAKIG